jgi:hypothetical protein
MQKLLATKRLMQIVIGENILNPHFSPGFVARRRRRAWIQGASGSFSASASEGPAGILDSMSRSPTERNAVDMPGSASAVEIW